ncbi:hypothetical protein M501DRAFT_999795 [Patellaria atrata CBS 101060]|uniref:SET domain-containing protein n=1 Tax=Patellaria atrata CBS 101060 TaxID=1346257 RepID=A0A9P4S1X4_9PEZI|nr:hypothetical protein M501DRAFT_999795 [Patellaria atrata CBS 101060]
MASKSNYKKQSPSAQAPKCWPEDITYLTTPRYFQSISPAALRIQKSEVVDLTTILPVSTGPSSNVRIKEINNPKHPAHGQSGLFAARHLAPDAFILQYLGFVHTNEDADPKSNYDLNLDRELGIGVDATHFGNEARFINDYRGISDRPNAEFREVWVEMSKGELEKRMGVFVLSAGKSGKRSKGITKNEEILVSYGKGFWRVLQNEALQD